MKKIEIKMKKAYPVVFQNEKEKLNVKIGDIIVTVDHDTEVVFKSIRNMKEVMEEKKEEKNIIVESSNEKIKPEIKINTEEIETIHEMNVEYEGNDGLKKAIRKNKLGSKQLLKGLVILPRLIDVGIIHEEDLKSIDMYVNYKDSKYRPLKVKIIVVEYNINGYPLTLMESVNYNFGFKIVHASLQEIQKIKYIENVQNIGPYKTYVFKRTSSRKDKNNYDKKMSEIIFMLKTTHIYHSNLLYINTAQFVNVVVQQKDNILVTKKALVFKHGKNNIIIPFYDKLPMLIEDPIPSMIRPSEVTTIDDKFLYSIKEYINFRRLHSRNKFSVKKLQSAINNVVTKELENGI